MSEKKNHNTIYFLTTLSVYLGLIVVGASPQVLAADKSTNNFVIQNRIDEDEIKSLTLTLDSYFNDLDEFLTNLKKLRQIEKLDLDFHTFDVKKEFLNPCPSSGIVITTSLKEKIYGEWLKPAITGLTYGFQGWTVFSDCFSGENFESKFERKIGFETSYDKQNLLLKLSFKIGSKQKAENFVNHIKIAHNLYELDEEEVALIKVLHKNTSFSKDDNNQVTIVTRLPRASIDLIIDDENKAK